MRATWAFVCFLPASGWALPAPRPEGTPTAVGDVVDTGLTGFSLLVGNDYLAFKTPHNDRGVTSDIELRLAWQLSTALLAVGLGHRVFREDRVGSLQRWDGGRLFVERYGMLSKLRRLELRYNLYGDVFFRGDLRGDEMQHFVHGLPGIRGDRLGKGLHDQYAPPRVGVTLGAGLRGLVSLLEHSILHVDVLVTSEGRLAPLATGVTLIAGAMGLRAELFPHGLVRPFAGWTRTVGLVTSNDPALLLRGGYNNDHGHLWGPSVELGLRLGRYKPATSLFIRITKNANGTGAPGGSGSLGWVGIDVGVGPWI